MQQYRVKLAMLDHNAIDQMVMIGGKLKIL